MQNKLFFLFDGACPLCLRETNFLKKKDVLNKINFVDINSKDYNPILFKDISYSEAMSNLHGILENGDVIKGLDVLAYAYDLIGLGWVYYPLKIQFIAPFLKLIYRFWAKYRLQLTGRSNIENQFGLREDEAIKIMRNNLKPKSFKVWRKRVSGRKTKHMELKDSNRFKSTHRRTI